MQLDLQDGLAEFLSVYEREYGKLAVSDSTGQQVFPSAKLSLSNAFKLVVDGRMVGYLRSDSLHSLGVVGPALSAHLCSQYWQQQHKLAQSRLVEEIRLRTELEEALKFMELKALQSQVNPHFLFNTLTTMAGVALLEGAEETSSLLKALSRLLRYSLRRIGQSVTLSEELASVNDYLSIQRARFGERIAVTMEITEDVLDAQIPVFTLQPLVENAIIHGLESREEGLLTVKCRQEETTVVIEVSDNGAGISHKRLAEIRESRGENSGRGHTTGIGIDNVHKRLQHFFGMSCNLHIESELNKGTQVSLRIPCVK